MVWGEKLVRKLLAGKRQIQMKIQIQILALVHRVDNGLKGGKSGKILAGKAPAAEEEEVEFVDLKLKAKVRPNKSFRPKLLTEPHLPLMLFPFCRSVGNTSKSNRCRDRQTACKARISKAFSWPLCSSLLAGVIFQSVQ